MTTPAETQDIQEPTPPHIAQMATQDVILERLAVIGIFGTAHAPAALIREKSGDIARVVVGDSIARHTVAGINEDTVILARNGKSKVLRLPTSSGTAPVARSEPQITRDMF